MLNLMEKSQTIKIKINEISSTISGQLYVKKFLAIIYFKNIYRT
jgi:hypothetical protein